MPYGDLAAARIQRFGSFADLKRAGVTLEEREEYDPHLEQGTVVYAGVITRDVLDPAVVSEALDLALRELSSPTRPLRHGWRP